MYAKTPYLINFATKTIAKNFHQLYFKIPATKVMGSPKIGVQDNNSDIKPYLLKNFVAFSTDFFLKYAFLIVNSRRYLPSR